MDRNMYYLQFEIDVWDLKGCINRKQLLDTNRKFIKPHADKLIQFTVKFLYVFWEFDFLRKCSW